MALWDLRENQCVRGLLCLNKNLRDVEVSSGLEKTVFLHLP